MNDLVEEFTNVVKDKNVSSVVKLRLALQAVRDVVIPEELDRQRTQLRSVQQLLKEQK